jgi:two-component system cell cycle response regulator
MTARVLGVDDVDVNPKLLEARLTADYFEVRTSRSGSEALEICVSGRADRFEACRRLKAEAHIPVTSLSWMLSRTISI